MGGVIGTAFTACGGQGGAGGVDSVVLWWYLALCLSKSSVIFACRRTEQGGFEGVKLRRRFRVQSRRTCFQGASSYLVLQLLLVAGGRLWVAELCCNWLGWCMLKSGGRYYMSIEFSV